MLKRRTALILVLVLVMSLFLTACGGSGSATATPTPASSAAASATPDTTVYTMSIAHNTPETNPLHLGHVYFANLLEEKSGGRIKVTIYPGGSVAANDREILEKVADGTTQFGNTTPSTLAAFASINDYYAWNIPYLYQTVTDIQKLGASDWQANLNKQFLEKTGVRPWNGCFSMGGWSWGTTKVDISNLDNLKGLKLRISDVPQQIALTEKMDAAPMFISFNEAFTALQQGAVDGMLTTVSLMYDFGFYENLKYIKETNQASCVHIPLINQAWYASLPADLQKIFDECLTEALPVYQKYQDDAYVNAYNKMTESGITISKCTDDEMKYLTDITKESVWKDEKRAQVSKDTINTVLDILGYSDQKLS